MASATRLNWVLIAVLLVSLTLRVTLAVNGGQYYFGDEIRYNRGASFYYGMVTADWAKVRDCIAQPEHAGFTFVAGAIAPLQHLLAFLTGHGDWSKPADYFETIWAAALVMAMLSATNVWLIYRIARAWGADRAEANWAAAFSGGLCCLTFYSRHLLPYDISLATALAAVWCAARQRPLIAGILTGLCFQIYNGYWFLTPIVALSLWLQRPTQAPVPYFFRFIAGLVGALLAVMLPGLCCEGRTYFAIQRGFAGSVKQGLFAEGWSLPVEYFWQTEHWLGLAMAVLIAVVLCRDAVQRRLPRRVIVFLILGTSIYALLAIASVGLHLFVVYGRTARAIAPFLALTGGYAVWRLVENRRFWQIAAVVALAFAVLLNWLSHAALVFPGDFAGPLRKQFGETKVALSFSGCIYWPRQTPVARPDLLILNAQALYPLRDPLPIPAGKVLVSVPNVANLGAYQFDGYTPRERRLLAEHPPPMQLILLDRPELIADQPPPALAFTAADRADGYDRNAPAKHP